MIVFGFIHPGNDVHTLGISSISSLLEECGYKVEIAGYEVSSSLENLKSPTNQSLFLKWLDEKKITNLGFSYRLDPQDAVSSFDRVYRFLQERERFHDKGGRLKEIYFAGLPQACKQIKDKYHSNIPVFYGDESTVDTLLKLSIPETKIPNSIKQGSFYDEERAKFSKQLIESGDHTFCPPPERKPFNEMGSNKDSLIKRLQFNNTDLPLFRAHVGPYLKDYKEAKNLFNSWLKTLAATKYLDIVSIGTSQLSQSNFGEDWGEKPNGGGVPVNSKEDFHSIWNASRPLLLRTYAGTKNIKYLAELYEETINSAWHALSLWWFNKLDGRGPNDVLSNLKEHFSVIDFIASKQKPFEPNIPHHFSFRGGDDVSYVLSAYFAAILAKKKGVKYFILQIMLNTPKATWGIQDLAKARALLKLTRELEDKNFKVILQPRAGLGYFSPNLEFAKAQLANVTAMMDDIEPMKVNSPDIIHVVSYCEAVHLAEPTHINESIQISITALKKYRELKAKEGLNVFLNNKEVEERFQELYTQVKEIASLLIGKIPNLFSPEGFYKILKDGVFPVPFLWEGREEFISAVNQKTKIINGSVKIVDELNKIIDPVQRVQNILLKNTSEKKE
jgi:hypothetical protein